MIILIFELRQISERFRNWLKGIKNSKSWKQAYKQRISMIFNSIYKTTKSFTEPQLTELYQEIGYFSPYILKDAFVQTQMRYA